MKVIGIKHLLKRGHSLATYRNKFERAMEDGSFFLGGIDLAVGPDYGMYFYDKKKKIDFSKVDEAVEYFKALSSFYSNATIIPGTMPFSEGNKLFHVAPVFINGKLDDMFFKESDCGESKMAKKNGFEYAKGDSTENYLTINGKKVAIEICSDFGKQRVPEGTFLETVLAYDNLGGFSVSAKNDNFSRYGLVCNSVKRLGPKEASKVFPVDCIEFNLDKFPNQRIVMPDIESKDYCGFVLT